MYVAHVSATADHAIVGKFVQAKPLEFQAYAGGLFGGYQFVQKKAEVLSKPVQAHPTFNFYNNAIAPLNNLIVLGEEKHHTLPLEVIP